MTEDEKQFLDENGYCVLKNAIPAELGERLYERSIDLVNQEREDPKSAFMYLDDKAQRVWTLVDKGEAFEEAIENERILAFHKYMLGDDLQLSSFSINYIGPGSPASPLHIDYPMGDLPTPLPDWTFCSNTVYLLTDFTLENGATSIIPNSHRRAYGPKWNEQYDGIVQVEGKKGDVIIVNGRIWHSSGENRSDAPRVGLLGFFCRGFMKPQQDHAALVRQEVWDRASPTLRKLMGGGAEANLLY